MSDQKKNKVRIGKPKISDEKIDSYKNFGRVISSYQKITQNLHRRPLYRNPKLFGGIVIIIAIAFLVWQATEEDMKNAGETQKIIDTAVTVQPAGSDSSAGSDSARVMPVSDSLDSLIYQ